MTIKRRLYTSFSLILAIILFIIGIFFYSIINLNNIHLLQNERYEQIRRVEKIKELNSAFAWLVLDIIVDKDKKNIVKDRNKKADELFESLWKLKSDVVKKAETSQEKYKLKSIFNSLEKVESLIKEDLRSLTSLNSSQNEFQEFHNQFNTISLATQDLIIEEIELLQTTLTKTENKKDEFIDKIKIELFIFILISFILSFLISTKLINEIKTMLKKLNSGVLQLFNHGENTIKINLEETNELSEITNSLNKYLEEQDDVIKSREELLRNISHELKTPITKGKFLLEKLKTKNEAQTLEDINKVFFDIETLTSKLLERERLNSATLNKTNFKISTLILEALSKLSIDDESKVLIDLEDDFSINADFYYLTIVLKNLIDNAMKYSVSYPIKIKTFDNSIQIQNNAKKLSHGLTYYMQPFTREDNQQQGHGLGLNIVNKILLMHEFTLTYDYIDSHNSFNITFKN